MTSESEFSSALSSAGLKERAVKSASVMLAAQGVKLALQVGSIAILARLLSPSDYGLVAMVTVFTAFATQFMDGGLSMATIQRDQITHAQVSSLFWINGALGIGLSLLGVLLSPVVSAIYDEPRLTPIMATMSLSFLIGGFSVQHDALLRRQMRFRAISVIDIISVVSGIAAGIIGALAGLGYWALVLSPIVATLVKTLLRWASSQWMPQVTIRAEGVRPLLNFGAVLTGANFLGYLATSITPFTLGYIAGPYSLGLFNRAHTLAAIPSARLLPPVMQVLQPTIARVADDATLLRRTITSLMGKIVLVTMYVTLTMAVLADWIVLVLLGPAWESAVPMFRALAIFSLVEPIAGFLAMSLVAVGNARALLQWKAVTLSILVASLLVGSLWGVLGVVSAYAASGVFIRLPAFIYFASRVLPVRSSEFMKVLWPPALCALGTAAILFGLRSYVVVGSPAVGLIVFAICAAVIYTTLCMFVGSARRELRETIGLIMLLRFSKPDSK